MVVLRAAGDEDIGEQVEHFAAQVAELFLDFLLVVLQHALFHVVLHQALGLVQHTPGGAAGTYHILERNKQKHSQPVSQTQ